MSSIQAGSGYIIGNIYNTELSGQYQLNGKTIIDSNANTTFASINTQNNSINAGSGLLNIGNIFAKSITIGTSGPMNVNSINTNNNYINAGSGSLTAGNITVNSIITQNSIINTGSGALTVGTINTQGNSINIGSGNINSTGTLYIGPIVSKQINTQNNSINVGSGIIYGSSILATSLTTTTINTQNNSINIGSGTIIASNITVGTITTQNNSVNIGSGTLNISNIIATIIQVGNISTNIINTQNSLINVGSGTIYGSSIVATSLTTTTITTQNNSINIGSGLLTAGISKFSNISINLNQLNQTSNSLDVNGNTSFGTYAGIYNAPQNGLIISGKVGIGTTNPQSNLHINGSFGVTYSTSNLLVVNQQQTSFGFNSLTIPYITVSNLTVLNNTNIAVPLSTTNNGINVGSGSITVGSINTQNYSVNIGSGTLIASNILVNNILTSNLTFTGSLTTINSIITTTSNVKILNINPVNSGPALQVFQNGSGASGTIAEFYDYNTSTVTPVFGILDQGLVQLYGQQFADINRNITTTTITTQNNTINAGSGTLTVGSINTQGASIIAGAHTVTTITTQNNNINVGSGTIISNNILVTNSLTTSNLNVLGTTTTIQSITTETSNFTISNINGSGPALNVYQSGTGISGAIASFYDYEVSQSVPVFSIADGGIINISGNKFIDASRNITASNITFNGQIINTGSITSTLPSSLQVNPISQTFKITTSTQKQFTLTQTMIGIYNAYSSNCEVYQNGIRLGYINSNLTDYNVSTQWNTVNNSNISTFIVTLTNAALYGDVISVTIWPSFYSNVSSFQPGYVYQVFSNLNWGFSNNNTVLTNPTSYVGIGTGIPATSLHVVGNITNIGNISSSNYSLYTSTITGSGNNGGQFEYDGSVLYDTPLTGQRGLLPGMQFYILNTDRTGQNSATNQNIFTTRTDNIGGTVNVSSGIRYYFESVIIIYKTGTTAATLAYGITGATINILEYTGTSYVTTVSTSPLPFSSVAGNNINYLQVRTITPGTVNILTATSGASAATYVVKINGYIDVGTGGAITPVFQMSAANTLNVGAGSYMYLYPLGSQTTNTSIGSWA